MPSASTLDTSGRFQGLFVGDSGSGKTPAACSFFHEGKVKDYDFDGRIRGLIGCPWIDRSKVDYEYIPMVNGQSTTFFDRFNKELDVISIQSRNGQLPFRTAILDSLTSQAWNLLKDAITLTKGNEIGTMKMAGPSDFNFESTGTRDIVSFFKNIPGINFIATAHLIDKYGPVDESKEGAYKGTKIVGTRLSLRDKLAAEIPGWFDHVFEFDRFMQGDTPRFRMRFWSDIARTTYSGMPLGWQDITNKDFYLFLQECIAAGRAKATDLKEVKK